MQVRKPQRRSKQREAIYQELLKFKAHPTAVELYEEVRKTLPKVSLGTVYRNLEQLVSCGMVNKLANGNSVRFDAEIENHKHIRCIICDNVADVHDIEDHPIKDSIEKLAGFKVVGCNVEFTGICPDCEDSEEAKKYLK
jgi:Fur family ferric uptake transcriptional regulator